MGQKLKIWATMTSIILLSGILGFGFSPDAFAKHDPNKTGNGFAEGCSNGTAKNNPHCSPDGPPAGIESPCDNSTADNAIDNIELAAWVNLQVDPDITEAQAQGIINIIETDLGGGGNGVIDTEAERDALNELIVPQDINPC